MDWGDLLAACALYLVLEGLMPFASPGLWRRSLAALAQFSDMQIRVVGLGSIVAGLVLLLTVRGLL